MNIAITLGWWLVPVLVTVAAFTWSIWRQDRRPAYDYGRIGQGIGNAILHGIAMVVSLTAWLIWALL